MKTIEKQLSGIITRAMGIAEQTGDN